MPRKTYKLTRLPETKRWRKQYRGNRYFFPFAEYPTAEQAWEAWLKLKTEINAKLDASKPHRAEYTRIITQLHSMATWCRQQGDNENCERYKETAKDLQELFDHSDTPPPITQVMDAADLYVPESPDKDFPHKVLMTKMAVWHDRLKHMLKPGNLEKTIGATVASFLKRKETLAQGGEVSMGRWVALRAHLLKFQAFLGVAYPVESISAKTLLDFHTHLLGDVNKNEISRTYAHTTMVSVRAFLRWCWEMEMCSLPRNIDGKDLGFNITAKKISTFDDGEITAMLSASSERTKLYLLLGLNCGMTQADIAALKRSEVDWKRGRITRKRTKTKDSPHVPTVEYPLWRETISLLVKHSQHEHPELALVNQNGSPLRTESIENGKYEKCDNIRSAYSRLAKKLKLRKSFKVVRKTAASKLATHETYKGYVPLFLGHSPRTIADKHYAAPSQELFDKAVLWLGEQFGMPGA